LLPDHRVEASAIRGGRSIPLLRILPDDDVLVDRQINGNFWWACSPPHTTRRGDYLFDIELSLKKNKNLNGLFRFSLA